MITSGKLFNEFAELRQQDSADSLERRSELWSSLTEQEQAYFQSLPVGGIAVYASRWGYHRWNWDTVQQLKLYHKLLYRAYRQWKHWSTWLNKEPQNRKGPEPLHFGPLSDIDPYNGRQRFALYQQNDLYQHILSEYRAIRRPSISPNTVIAIDLPNDWEWRLAQLMTFYDINKGNSNDSGNQVGSVVQTE